ncbi:hypothetical protein DPMN_169243 [Dreissena polymorpha]|uniref:Uncharacterized protein n=1 Tax=Dreissena polymorpha TaxID=45954 RepID=A0A9D4J0E4_DREPO|nr:hypothetical protein DPMN_169243 [Dreissena polymorpha]
MIYTCIPIEWQRIIARWTIVVLYPPTIIDMKDKDNKDAYDFLNRTRNPAEELYNYLGEVVEDEVEEYSTGCCHSSSSDTDTTISDSCLQYLTAVEGVGAGVQEYNEQHI